MRTTVQFSSVKGIKADIDRNGKKYTGMLYIDGHAVISGDSIQLGKGSNPEYAAAHALADVFMGHLTGPANAYKYEQNKYGHAKQRLDAFRRKLT